MWPERLMLLSALPTRRKFWITVATYTGGRFSEVEALRWEQHVDLDSGTGRVVLELGATASDWDRLSPVPVCIYCQEEKEADAFDTEHVFPDAFGAFSSAAPTLSDPTVCKGCNSEFGETLDLYLARDTPMGLARFHFGLKSPDEFKSLGKRSSMKHQLQEGRLKGAWVFVERSSDGLLKIKPLPQIGAAKGGDGPFEWFLCEELPEKKDELHELVRAGHHYVEFVEVLDMPKMLETLRGYRISLVGDLRETAPAGERGIQPVESAALLIQPFGRAIAKIGMNYLAFQHGPAVARLAPFDAIRRYIRDGDQMPRSTWWGEHGLARERHVHWVAVFWEDARRRVVAEVCFFGAYRYRVVLAEGGFVTNPPFGPRGHLYNLMTKRAEPLPKSALLALGPSVGRIAPYQPHDPRPTISRQPHRR